MISDEKVKFRFGKFVSVMANVSLNREAAAVKEIGGWLFQKKTQIIAKSTKTNKSRASRDIF